MCTAADQPATGYDTAGDVRHEKPTNTEAG